MTSKGLAQDACFADEVAIDFPSVGYLAERVRDGFLGEPDAVHTLDVGLSRRDAQLGTVIPLRVPLQGTCLICGGRGETWTDPCGPCLGTGSALVHHWIRLSVPPGVVDGARFRFHVSSSHASPLRVEVRVTVRPSAA